MDSYKTNLYEEIKFLLRLHDKTESDIHIVSTSKGIMTWDDFKKVAITYNYYLVSDTLQIDPKLKIVGDGFVIDRMIMRSRNDEFMEECRYKESVTSEVKANKKAIAYM